MRRSRLHRKRSFRLETLEPRCLLAANVFISEFMASNDDTLFDEDGDSSDWIEVYNDGPDDANLGGWYLTDDDADLDKWGFPDQLLPAGNFLLVYASDKDRAVAGEPLHTNFRLGAGGEYLALTQDVLGDVHVVSEFAPEFPEQITDVSFGVTQQVEVNGILAADDSAKLLIPSSTPDSSWTTIGYDDLSWADATAAIGYQNTVAGITVEVANSSSSVLNLSTAEAVLNGQGQVSRTIAITPTVNFFDSGGGGGVGRFGDDLDFPNDTGGDDNDFAVRATGTITIPIEDTWTFGTNSDDGARLRIDGADVIIDDTLHAPEDRFGSQTLSAGQHSFELIFFERGGGAEVELFAAQGFYSFWNSTFRLVGDVASGGLLVETSPTGGEVGLGSLINTDLIDDMFDEASSAYLRVPFTVSDVAAIDSLTLRMHYDDGFAAHINGVEVARRNAPEVLSYDSTATTDRTVLQAGLVEDINISDAVGLLNEGDANVLAIQGLNASIDADEFLLRAELAEIDVESGNRLYFPTPTPRDFNPATGVEDFLLSDVSFSQEHGFYEDAFQLTIESATEGTTIRYTNDGTEPTVTRGFAYGDPITVNGTTTIRARSFKTGTEPSFVETATYLFINDILQQSPNGQTPAGWPTSTNINGQRLDYGMNPQIVNNGTWGPQLAAALTQIPTMSIVLDIDDLLGASSGIYTHANSHGRAWERPMSLELINPDGSEGFQINGGIRIRGGFSRTGNNPKHAFRLFFRDEYGDSRLEYPLFGDDGAPDFKKIDLRTTQNYSWAFQGDGRNNFVRDIFSRDVQALMGQPSTRGDYLHLYINGQYWGVFQTQERPEANYAESYFGGDSNDYDVVKSAGNSGGYENEATDGNLEAYQRLADYFYQAGGLSDNNIEEYWRAQGMNPDGTPNPDYERLLDVDNLIDYMIITYFTSDADGPGSKFTRPRVNNYFGIFNRENPDGFKFFEHDSEHSLDTGNAAGANGNMVTPLTTGGSQFRYFNPHWMHERLAETNSVYRDRFADAVYRNLYHDGPLSVANAQALIDARAAEIDVAMIAESARWGDAQRGTPYSLTDWQNAVASTRNWLANRHDVVLNQLRGQNWYPDLDPPEFNVNGQPQHGGEISNLDRVGLVESGSLIFDSVLAQRSVWRYLDDGSDQGTAWRELVFDDLDWQSGAGELGYGDGGEATVVSFGDFANNKYRTTYFRRELVVSDDPAGFEQGLIRLIRDDGAVVYINGQEVARVNMPNGAINYQTEAITFVGGAAESTYFDYEFDPAVLNQGTNVIAVEIHQSSGTSSDISFDLELLLGSSEPIGGTGVFYTTDGSDPRLEDGAVNPAAQESNGEGFSLPDSAVIKTRVFRNNQWSVLNTAEFNVSSIVIPGDLDGDGDVDTVDLNALVQNWTGALMPGEGNKTREQGDTDGDGDVDSNDRTVLVQNWTGAIQMAVVASSRSLPLSTDLQAATSSPYASADTDSVDNVFSDDEIDEVLPGPRGPT